MPKSRSHKERKRKQEEKRNTPPLQLLQQGRQKLEEGDARQALDYLKLARQGDKSPGGLYLLLFRAYSLRAQQLAAKGMAKEAAVTRDLADQHWAAIDPQALSADEFVQYLHYVEMDEAIRVYRSYRDSPDAFAVIERVLADRLVVGRTWEALSELDAGDPLRRDAEVVKEAIPDMDEGNWDQAGAVLAAIPRRSPFAHWRVFCKAMSCFNMNDTSGLRRALDLLPQDFILPRVVEELRGVCSAGVEDASRTAPPQARVRQALGLEGSNGERLARELLAATRRRSARSRELERLLPALAETIYPEDRPEAYVALLEVLAIAARQNSLPLEDVQASRRLLPPDRRAAVAARIELLTQQVSHDVWNLAPAATYLAHVHAEFPDAHQQSLARARVLEFLARSGRKGGACPYCTRPQVIGALRKLVGEYSEDPEMVFADLMLSSLEADPDNREGYDFLLELLRGATAARPKVATVLNDMAARFPDDPAPCLELARLHYSSNAYRKAERTLEEARRRAPHDDRILDMQAIGYVKSADQSRKRKNYRLVEQDLQRAEALDRSGLAQVLLVKRLGLRLITSGPKATQEIGHSVESLPVVDQLRALALLILDLSDVKHLEQGTMTRLKRTLASKKGSLDQLSGEEAVGLLSPVNADFSLVFPRRQVAPVLADWWTPLMARAQGEDLIAIFDILLACQGRSTVRAEINRRLPGSSRSARDPLLLFYLAVIRHMEGKVYGSQEFQEILDTAGASLVERLRVAAARLAPYTHGPLQEALRRFEFRILDSPFSMFEAGLPGIESLIGGISDLDEDDDGSFYDGDGVEEPDEEDEVDELEALLDEAGVRGAPMRELQDFVGRMRSDPQRRRDLDEVARRVEARFGDLSRELQVLLFPKGQRSGRRTR